MNLHLRFRGFGVDDDGPITGVVTDGVDNDGPIRGFVTGAVDVAEPITDVVTDADAVGVDDKALTVLALVGGPFPVT